MSETNQEDTDYSKKIEELRSHNQFLEEKI